jgi:hypothetical protein
MPRYFSNAAVQITYVSSITACMQPRVYGVSIWREKVTLSIDKTAAKYGNSGWHE